MATPSRRTLSRGFTLLEVLVVGSIFAVLAAMLFPIFFLARERGRQVVCLRHMKQIGSAFSLYLQDWDDTYPMNQFPTLKALHLDKSVGLEPTWYNWKRALREYVSGVGVFQCPSNDHSWDVAAGEVRGDGTNRYSPWRDRPEMWLPNGYAYNGAFFHENAPLYEKELQRPRTAGEVPAPSRLILLAETSQRLSAVHSYYIVNEVFLHPASRMSNWVMASLEVKTLKESETFARGYWGESWITPEGSERIAQMLQTRGR